MAGLTETVTAHPGLGSATLRERAADVRYGNSAGQLDLQPGGVDGQDRASGTVANNVWMATRITVGANLVHLP